MTNKPISLIDTKKSSGTISPELIDTAAFLRRIAAKIESGDTVAVAVAWVTKDCEVGWDHRFDGYGHTLLGIITRTQMKLASELDSNDQ